MLYRWPLVLLIPKMDQQTLTKLSPLVSIAPFKIDLVSPMRNRTIPDAFPSFTNFVCHLEGVQDQTCFGRLLLGLSHSISGIAESFLAVVFAALYDFTGNLESEVRPILIQTHSWSVIFCFHPVLVLVVVIHSLVSWKLHEPCRRKRSI